MVRDALVPIDLDLVLAYLMRISGVVPDGNDEIGFVIRRAGRTVPVSGGKNYGQKLVQA